MNQTQKALLARGVDIATSEQLVTSGYTLASLKLLDQSALIALGMPQQSVVNLLNESRPPIASETVAQVLHANRRTCCVCRQPERSVILHHINPWHVSRDHSPENLAVLCLLHHDEAHSQKSLSLNLDQKSLRAAKAKWEAEVVQLDSRHILKAANLANNDRWDYINQLRIFELAQTLGIDLTDNQYFDYMVALNAVDKNGVFKPRKGDGYFYFYDDGNILPTYAYIKEVVRSVLEKTKIINISDDLDIGNIEAIIRADDLIAVQGAHYFRDLIANKSKGVGQNRLGFREANHVRIEFLFDAWEATSSSSKNMHLSGRTSALSISRVRDLSRDGKQLVIKCSSLLIGTGFEDLRTRTYGSIPPGVGSYGRLFGTQVSDRDDDDDDDFL